MRPSGRLLAVLAVTLVLFTCLARSAPDTPNDHNEATAAVAAKPTSARARFQLPKLFDFSRFKALFAKSYRSLVEELARQKIFLARAFKAFISAVGYKHGKSSWYLSVNQMSDMTPDDFESMRVPLERLVDLKANRRRRPQLHNEEDDASEEPIEAVELEDIERALEEVEQRRDEPGYREIAAEFEKSSIRRRRSTGDQPPATTSSGRRELSADDLMRDPRDAQESEAMRAKMVRRVPSNNPDREQPEFMSFGTSDSEDTRPVMEGGLAKLINNIPGASFVGSLLNAASNIFKPDHVRGGDDQMDVEVVWQDPSEELPAPEMPKDEVYVNHVDSNCFFLPRSQGKCGSCYAFAAVAYIEYLYCLATGHPVAFSEQYLIDCGRRQNLRGCQGAFLKDTSLFIKKYGLELRVDYPYRMKEDKCPYDPQATQNQMGYIRLKNDDFGYLPLSSFDKHLRTTGPIMYVMALGPEFHHYGGGVHEMQDCTIKDGHAMLIVGHGLEDGKEYYMLRNSHSVSWGEAGYYKISKKSFATCKGDANGYVVTGKFGQKQDENMNRNYGGQANLKRRYKEYLLSDAAAKRKKNEVTPVKAPVVAPVAAPVVPEIPTSTEVEPMEDSSSGWEEPMEDANSNWGEPTAS